MNQIKLLEKTFKAGSAVLISAVLAFGGLFLNLANTSASESPNMTVRMLVNDDNDSPDAGWQHDLNSQGGHRVSFAVEIHNTVVGTEAKNVHVQVGFPSNTANTLNIPVNISADNANNASDNVTIHVTSPTTGAQIKYVAHSTRLYWDPDGDSSNGIQYNNTPLVDGIVDGGLTLGDQKGCNNFIIQVTFLAELVGEQPTPSPSPTPVGGINITNNNTNNNSQSQTQNNNQTVNVTATGSVAGASVPVKQPETGASVLGLASMFSAAPFGLALSRYGRGRLIGKREEDISEVANGLVEKRSRTRAGA